MGVTIPDNENQGTKLDRIVGLLFPHANESSVFDSSDLQTISDQI